MKRLLAYLLCTVLLLCVFPSFSLSESDEVLTISDREALLQIAAHPDGSFELTDDIDMSGADWQPIPFSGRLNGNGHTFYNLSVHAVGQDTETTYDGNGVAYETVFAGLFSVVRNAEITDLHLVNTVISMDTDQPCFTGALAGFASSSVFTGCSVDLRSHLTVTSLHAGIGGLVGYSDDNEFHECLADAELVFTDCNADAICEEFIGGIFASGCGNVWDCKVHVKGFCEVYGYAHNGGVIGMFRQPRQLLDKHFSLRRTESDTAFSFFEIAPARRAYCNALIGENLGDACRVVQNTAAAFQKNESREPVRMSPEACETPHYTAVETPHTHESWGYTTYTCDGCGYAYRDAYTPAGHTIEETRIEPTCTEDGSITRTCTECGESETQLLPATGHVPGELITVREPSTTQEGLQQRVCTVCGAVLESQSIPMLLIPVTKIDAERIVLSHNSLGLQSEQIAYLNAVIYPDNVTDPSVIYTSSDPSVAEVFANGAVKAKKQGTATITAASGDGKVFDTCTVTVTFTFAQWFRYYILFGWLKNK